MSTRSSLYVDNGLHLYVEQDYGELCLDYPDSGHLPKRVESKKYSSFTMPLSAWEDFAKDILKGIEKAKSFGAENQNVCKHEPEISTGILTCFPPKHFIKYICKHCGIELVAEWKEKR